MIMDQEIDVKSSDFDIRYMEVSDAPIMQEWLKDPDVLLWLPISDEKESKLFVDIWVGYSKFHGCLTATWKHKPCGMSIVYLLPYRKVAHRCLSQVVVPSQSRNQGVESALVKNMAHLAKSYFRLETIQMEVIDGAPVIPYLKERGFTEFVRQEKYFKRGDSYSARILYECDLRDESKR